MKKVSEDLDPDQRKSFLRVTSEEIIQQLDGLRKEATLSDDIIKPLPYGFMTPAIEAVEESWDND